MQEYIAELSKLYKETSALWRRDPDPESFEWIECNDSGPPLLDSPPYPALGFLMVTERVTSRHSLRRH